MQHTTSLQRNKEWANKYLTSKHSAHNQSCKRTFTWTPRWTRICKKSHLERNGQFWSYAIWILQYYWSWKAPFLSPTKDLNLSARKEPDLMITWLLEKYQHKTISAVHVLGPTTGSTWFGDVWGVLSKDALLKEIEQLLSDFLLDLEYAKEDGALTGFSEYSSWGKKWLHHWSQTITQCTLSFRVGTLLRC